MKTPLRPLRLALLLALSLTMCLARAAEPAPGDSTPGIKFFVGTWQQLLAEAKKQNKPVFVDVYTAWCGPCKLMEKKAFPDKAVGDLFNANFVNYRLDAEKGEGPMVAKRYSVQGYPTLLYVSASGDLLYRGSGYSDKEGLLDVTKKALEAVQTSKPIGKWDNEFDTGNRDPEFLKTYLSKRAELKLPNAEALDAYLAILPKTAWTTDETTNLIIGNLTATESKAFNLLLESASGRRTDSMWRRSVGRRVKLVTSAILNKDIKNEKTEADLQRNLANKFRLDAAISAYPFTPAQRQDASTTARLAFYIRTKNQSAYRQFASETATVLAALTEDSIKAMNADRYRWHLNINDHLPAVLKNRPQLVAVGTRMKTSGGRLQVADYLNGIAMNYVKMMADPADLNQALTWSARSLALQRVPDYLDTYAQLLGKLGQKTEPFNTRKKPSSWQRQLVRIPMTTKRRWRN